MDLAMRFNDVGCILYEAGRAEDAFDMFSGAMQAMHHSCGGKVRDELDSYSKLLLLIDPSVQRAFDRVSTFGVVSPPKVATALPSKVDDNFEKRPVDQRSLNVNQGKNMTTQNLFDVYQSADSCFIWMEVFAIEGVHALPCSPEESFALVMAIILYNEALVLHRGQISNKRRHLEKAMTFYSMAGRSLLEHCSNDLIQSSSFTSTLCSAILNNTGYILHQMGEFTDSQHCFAKLNELLMQLPLPESEQERRRRIYFGLNFILFHRSLSTASAA